MRIIAKPKILSCILLCALFSVLGYAQQRGDLYAVLVGVSKYSNSEKNLTYCHEDAKSMYDVLKLQTHESRLKLLTDDNATQANIVMTAEALFSQTKPEDMVIFFFSGHGTPGMFIAHDKPLEFSKLQTIFKKTKAKRKIIFADSCFSGSFRTSGDSATKPNTGLDSSVMLFLSSRTGQPSLESPNRQGGLFTWYLTMGLKGGADANRDRVIVARELFNFVNPRVSRDSKGKQIPVMWGKFSDNMIIADWR
ncbi:MAG: caspase family protein [Holophagaceae bacterium]|nr:caspase family protein [Holophagaceae bacterium]